MPSLSALPTRVRFFDPVTGAAAAVAAPATVAFFGFSHCRPRCSVKLSVHGTYNSPFSPCPQTFAGMATKVAAIATATAVKAR